MASMHVRSNSFPSAPHPIVSQFQEHLNRLKSSESASSSSSVSHKLVGLQDLHGFTDKFLQLSTVQQSLARECNEKSVDQLLEGSLMILDVCSMAKDCLQQSKESVHELQSVMRRRGVESGCRIEGGKYLASRKMMKKAIRKALASLKETLKDSSNSKDTKTLPILSIFKEAKDVTVTSLESLLLLICAPKGQLKQSRWSAISKMMQPKRTGNSEMSSTNEFQKVYAALESLMSHKNSSMENFESHLENLEMCIQDLAAGIESLSRQLIKARVQLLNIFNH